MRACLLERNNLIMSLALIATERKAMEALLDATNMAGAMQRNCEDFLAAGAVYEKSKLALQTDIAIIQTTITLWRSVSCHHPKLASLGRDFAQLQKRLDRENTAWDKRTRLFWSAHATGREQLRKCLHIVYWWAARYDDFHLKIALLT